MSAAISPADRLAILADDLDRASGHTVGRLVNLTDGEACSSSSPLTIDDLFDAIASLPPAPKPMRVIVGAPLVSLDYVAVCELPTMDVVLIGATAYEQLLKESPAVASPGSLTHLVGIAVERYCPERHGALLAAIAMVGPSLSRQDPDADAGRAS